MTEVDVPSEYVYVQELGGSAYTLLLWVGYAYLADVFLFLVAIETTIWGTMSEQVMWVVRL
jgi:hypothetical protein